MTTSDPQARRDEDDGRAGPEGSEQGYSATGNATGTNPTERATTGGGDDPAANHIAADRLPGRAGPYDADPDDGGRAYSGTGNATGAGHAAPGGTDPDSTERTVTGGGSHPAAANIAADRLSGRTAPGSGGGRDDARDDGPADPQGPRTGERT